MQGALIFIIAGVAGYGLGFPVYGQLVRWNALDYPNSRSSHDKPTARGAGVAIIITILLITLSLPEAWAARQTLALLSAALVLTVVSLIDDLKSVSAFWRLGCHAAAAITWLVTLGWPRIGGGSALELKPGSGAKKPRQKGQFGAHSYEIPRENCAENAS